MPKTNVDPASATTEWARELLAARQNSKGKPKYKAQGFWPMTCLEMLAKRINPFIAGAQVSLWTYIRWERGERTPPQKRQDEVRAALLQSGTEWQMPSE